MDQQSAANGPNEWDYIYSTSIFGGFKRIIQSKNFQGGNITIIFGGVELDFTHADLATAEIDITQAFGEVKLFVPQGWRIDDRITHFLSVTKDYRIDARQNNENAKVLTLKGFCTFAAVELVSSDIFRQ